MAAARTAAVTDFPRVLLTNDDGVDAPGIAALRDALEPVADVTVVAPAADQSGVGRRDAGEAAVEHRDGAVVLDATPAACVHAGLDRYAPDADLVVSGVNEGPNIGEHVVGRSGTVGAAFEAAFYDTPGLALSLYDPPEGKREFAYDEYDAAARFARFAVEEGREAGLFDGAPVLNVNAPADPPDPPTVRVTEPGSVRGVETTLDDGVLQFHDTFYAGIRPERPAEMDHPVGTDIRACHDLEVSVTPLDPRFRGGDVDPDAFEAFGEVVGEN